MNILVTGGSGLVGKHLKDVLPNHMQPQRYKSAKVGVGHRFKRT